MPFNFLQRKNFIVMILALSLVILLALLPGCNFMGLSIGGGQKKPEGGGGGGGGQEEKTKIGLSLAKVEKGPGQEIQKLWDEKKDKEKLEIVVKDAKMDAMQQTIDVEDLINQKVKVIVIDMVDPSQGEKLVPRIMEKGIKVVALYNLPQNAPVDAYITPDNKRAGELQAQFVAAELDSGKVLIVEGDKKSNVAEEITAGNLLALQQAPQLQVLDVKDHPEWEADEAEETVRQVLVENDNKLGAIIANSGEMAMAATKVLKEMKLEKQVVTVGVDADMDALEGIQKDEHDAVVERSPEMVAQFALQAAKQLAEGETWTDFDRKITNGEHDVPVKITPVQLINKDNLDLMAEKMKEMKKEEEKGKEEGKSPGVEKVGEEQGQGGEGGQGGGGSGGGGSGGQQGGQQAQGKSKVMIKTQDGQQMEFELDGETLELEIEGRLMKIETKAQQGQGGQEGGGQGGGQGGGGGGGGGGGSSGS